MRLAVVAVVAALEASCNIAHAQMSAMGVGHSGPSPARVATVTANLSNLGYTIPNNFVGLSSEVGDLISGYFQGTSGANGTYVSLVNLLGSHGVWRIGGLSSDGASAAPALTSGIASAFASFISGLGANWTVIYGLDLRVGNAALAATQAGYVATVLGAGNVTFQFGNEPDGYYTQSQYVTAWNSYYASVSGSVSGANYAAYDGGSWARLVTYTTGLSLSVSQLKYLTQHWYNNCNGPPAWTPAQVINSLNTNLTPYFGIGGISVGFAQNQYYAGSTAEQLSESNSCSSGGLAGVSDRLSGATWYVNEAITFANLGWSGINTHNAYTSFFTPNGPYNPVVQETDNNFGPGPIFYGLFLFSKIEGQQTAAVSIGGNANVNAIATKGGNGNANILVVNNDQNSPVTVTPAQSSAWTTANVLKMSTSDGANCTSANPIVGGQPIGEGGTWTGSSVALASGASVTLQPCEAALIQIQP